MAKAFLIGNIGIVPEIKTTREGREYARFRVATEKRWLDKEGQWTGRTSWFTVIAFGKIVERCATLQKGMLVCVEGQLQTSKSEDGREWTEVSADQIKLLRKPREDADFQGFQGPPEELSGLPPAFEGNDIPF